MRVPWNEDMRVKFPATVQFMRLGYEYQSLKDADIHPETRIFLNRFVPAIQRINSDKNLTVEQILATIEEIHGIIKNNDMGKEFLGRLLDQTADIKLIDFDHPEDNDFAVVDELTFGPEAKGSFRPDINILVNGIPLGFLEVKKPNNEGGIQKEFHRMLDERLQVPEFKKYFNMLQFVTFSNNMEYETDNDAAPAEEVRAGSFYSTPNGNRTFFSFFREENPKTSGFKEIYMDEVRYILKDNGYSPSYADTEEFQTNLQSSTPCNRFVTSFFDIPRMMYLLQYGFFYVDTIDEKTGQPVTQKHIMRYPQFFASQAILKRIDGGGKSGIIFHTQGSGKTELSAFSIDGYKQFTDAVTDIQKEIRRNKNTGAEKIVSLEDLLKKIFVELEYIDLNNLSEVNGKLLKILEDLRCINEENERLAARYGGNYAFVKTYSDVVEMHPEFDKEDLAKLTDVAYAAVKDIEGSNILILHGRESFVNTIKKNTTTQLLKSGLYKKLNLKDWYADFLGETYSNMRIF